MWPLAPSLDTVGPLARDVAGLVRGMELLEPGFGVAPLPARLVVGRLRVAADPAIDAAVDDALAKAGFEVVDTSSPRDGTRRSAAAAATISRPRRGSLTDTSSPAGTASATMSPSAWSRVVPGRRRCRWP